MWVNRHKLNNSLVIFVHGLFGNPWTSWRGVPERLQEAMPHDPALRSYDIYLFHYDTRWRRQPKIEPFVRAMLATFVDDVRPKYETIALVGHSQGGIVAKLYVLDILRAGRGLEVPIDVVVTFGTPHRGSWVATLTLPLPGLAQARQLTPWSLNMRTLRKEWNTATILGEDGSSTRTSRTIRSVTGVGAYDRMVRQRSAEGFEADTPSYHSKSHPDLAKAENAFLVVSRELRRNLAPTEILSEIKDIETDPDKAEAYGRNHAHLVAPFVQRGRRLGVGSVEDRMAWILDEFLRQFPQRPLRGLSFAAALETFARRSLEPEL